jgi:hypothetical protein
LPAVDGCLRVDAGGIFCLCFAWVWLRWSWPTWRTLSLVQELADGVLNSAAVLRGCLGQPTPPLCRCAEYTADQLSRVWRVFHCMRLDSYPDPVTWLAIRRCAAIKLALATQWAIHRCTPIKQVRSTDAWCAQRSGIKEEAAGRGTAAELCTPSGRAGPAREINSESFEAVHAKRQRVHTPRNKCLKFYCGSPNTHR